MLRQAGIALGLLLSGSAAAQQTPEAGKPVDATTLPVLRVTAPRPEVLDLGAFKNPIQPNPSRFDEDYQPPPSMEDISMNGGIIPYIVGYVAQKVTFGARKLPGWKDPEQPAIARPPPLDDAQMERAARLLESSPP